MQFSELRFRNFRNFDDLQIHLQPKVNLFLGRNGQGKTNLLEGIYFLSRGRSFRSGEKDSLTRLGTESGFLHGVFHDGALVSQIDVRLSAHRTEISMDQKKISPRALSQRIPVVLFSPDHLASIKGGPELRRELLDRALVLSEPETADVLGDFEKALRSRNRLLRDISEGQTPLNQGEGLLEAINSSYFRVAARLAFLRKKLLVDLQQLANESLGRILGQNTNLQFDYQISDSSALHQAEDEIQDTMTKRAQELRAAELSRGHSLVGPHKHDIVFLFEGQNSRFFCSQGQQRSIILSFNIAEIVHHHRKHAKYPLLLLDDVLSELDAEKRFFLVRFLKELDTQTLVTSTELSSFEDLKGASLTSNKIEGGHVVSINGA